MSNDTIISKIELIQEQIENLERSGRFTESEIDKQTQPLKTELSNLKLSLSFSETGKLALELGFTIDEFVEACKRHNALFDHVHNIEVNDAEILTQKMEEV